uniref:Beta-1,4-galactosyltransferase n=1 Tax=Arion vulgaris TaxID=1028688 RepID=A0A0B7A0Q6_9EUPU
MKMEKCSKFKLFNILLLLCAGNFLVYRYFIQSHTLVVASAGIHTNSPAYLLDVYRTALNDTRNILSIRGENKQDITNENRQDIPNENKLNSINDNRQNLPNDYRHNIPNENKLNNINDKQNINNDNKLDIPYENKQYGISNNNNEMDIRKFSISTRASTINFNSVSIPIFQRNLSSQLPVKGLSSDMRQKHVTSSESSISNLCPLIPPRLNGNLATITDVSSWQEIADENAELKPGGRYKPSDCVSRHRVAIIIPFRNREEHLMILLKNLIPMLSRQQLDYGIFVIEQVMPGKFNRAMLMNIGYTEAMKTYDYQCVVFHDVDLVPENDRNIYSCPQMPRHLSAAIDKFHYRLPYTGIYGGVSAVNKEQFQTINGFSNMFFGWGGEDDDMAYRISHAGYKITRYPMDIARYKMIKHVKDAGNEQNPLRFALLKNSAKRMFVDGLNSLVYQVQEVLELSTHLRIRVLINETDILKGKLHLLL